MQFHNITHSKDAKELGEYLMTLTPQQMARCLNEVSKFDVVASISYAEWCRNRCPYYVVYPKVIPMLTRIKLDIPCKAIQLPMPTLLIRLPVIDNPLAPVKTILVGQFVDGGPQSQFFIRTEYQKGSSVGWFHQNDQMVEDVCRDWEEKDRQMGKVDNTLPQVLKLISTLCLLRDDPSIITPDVLADDRNEWELGDEKRRKFLEDRARRRGKIGWNIGARIEMMPHYRHPHLGIRWTGEGRKIPKIVSIRGCIVHREVVEKIPTGYEQQTMIPQENEGDKS